MGWDGLIWVDMNYGVRGKVVEVEEVEFKVGG